MIGANKSCNSGSNFFFWVSFLQWKSTTLLIKKYIAAKVSILI